MLLGALLDAGADLDAVRTAVHSLGISGVDVSVHRTRRCGLTCLQAKVSAPVVLQPTRRLAEVLAVIEAAHLTPAVARMTVDTFQLLAQAEAAVHGIAADLVHFHEVGAVDALADVVGTAAAAEQLGLLSDDAVVTCSALAAGTGTARSAHGAIPVPAPAVLRIVSDRGLSLTGGELAGERTTPTGAALVAVLATPGPLPSMTVDAVGSGAGTRDGPERPNITRLVVGQRTEFKPESRPVQAVTVVETTVDDLEPELWPVVLHAVRAAGAWDCWTTPTIGRHGRPGRVLTALCTEQIRPAVVDAIFRHSTTLGVRWSRWHRTTLPRIAVQVRVGPSGAEQQITIKVAVGPGGHQTAKPELAEAERIARILGWPVRRVCEAAKQAYAHERQNGVLALNATHEIMH